MKKEMVAVLSMIGLGIAGMPTLSVKEATKPFQSNYKPSCSLSQAARLLRFDDLMKENRYVQARQVWDDCDAGSDADAIAASLRKAFDAEQVQIIASTQSAMPSRIEALEKLQQRQSPELTSAVRAFPEVLKAQRKIIDAEAAQIKANQKEIAAQKKREGVRLGYTEADVLASSWGKPDKINRTTTARGTREQWVYRSRLSGYLYFENGVLVTVQN